MTRRRVLATAAGGLVATAWLDAAPRRQRPEITPHRLDRLDLLRFVDDAGVAHAVTSAGEWARRRDAIVQGMQQVMGAFPLEMPPASGAGTRRAPPEVETLDEADAGTYVRRSIAYRVDAGPPTPAWLCIPKPSLTGAPAPAVLCLHPTDDAIGPDVVVGLGGRPNRAYAAELAARGFVTLAPAYPQLARYQPDILGLGYASGTMKAIHDNVRGLDLLDSLPFVRGGRHGAIGQSLGGHNAIFTAVFDPRIAALVSSCGFDLFIDYYDGRPDVWRQNRGWCQVRYMPRLLAYAGRLDDIPFDFAELLGALAPRPCLVSAPLRDDNFRWRSVDRATAAARQVYGLLGAPEALMVRHPDADHDFPTALRQEAYAVLQAALH